MNFNLIFSIVIVSLTFISCNKVNSENQSDLPNKIDSNYSLPDSIIDAGINSYYIRRVSGGKISNFKKGLTAHENYNRVQVIEHLKNKIGPKEAYSEAIHYYTLSLRNNEYHKNLALENRAVLRLKFGDFYGAISDYEKLINKQPIKKTDEFHLLKAFCHLKINDIPIAESIIDSLIINYENRILTLERNNRKPNKYGLTASMEADTRYHYVAASSYYYKGIINYMKANKIEACNSWSKASELDKGISQYAALYVIQTYCK